MPNENSLKNLQPPFKKGDKRINRKGRPKSFDKLRKLAQQIAGEDAIPGEITRVELMLRAMASSKNPSDRALFLAYAFGKPKDELDITSNGKTIVVELLKEDE